MVQRKEGSLLTDDARFTFALFFLVGMPGWALVNALYLQLPILMSSAPEGYSIAAYLVVGVQLGNLFGFACAFFQSYCSIKVRSPYLVLALLLFTLLIDVLLALFWHQTAFLFGHLHRYCLIATLNLYLNHWLAFGYLYYLFALEGSEVFA